MRIVSLLPSATETLCLVGGSSLLVGRSHECDFPVGILDRPVLTAQTAQKSVSGADDRRSGTGRTIAIGRLRSLAPDVVLAGGPGTVDHAALDQAIGGAPGMPEIVSFSPTTVEDVFEDALRLGRVIGREDAALSAVVALRERFYRACEFVTPFEEGPRVVVLESLEPLVVGGWWTPQLVERAGGTFPLNPTEAKEDAGAAAGFAQTERTAGAARAVTVEELLAVGAEAVVVCLPGLGLEEIRVETTRLAEGCSWWKEIPAVRSGRVAMVDGRRGFARGGPGLVDVFAWMVGWLGGRGELTGGAGVLWEGGRRNKPHFALRPRFSS